MYYGFKFLLKLSAIVSKLKETINDYVYLCAPHLKTATGIARSISPGQTLRQTSSEISTFNTAKVSKKARK